MIDPKTLRHLMKMMVENGLTELRVEGEGEKIVLKRGGVAPAPAIAPPAPQPAHDPAKPTDSNPSASSTSPPLAATGETIDSPMVGTFYASPSPDAAPFLKPGDRVGPETVVCIIEAMKVFNEIKAETTGTVKRTLVETGEGVEFGQPLFEIE